MNDINPVPKRTIQIAGENALIIYFSSQVSEKTANEIKLATLKIQQTLSHYLLDLTPSYASLLVTFDMNKVDHHHLRNELRKLLATIEEVQEAHEQRVIELPVCYDIDFAPELNLIAKHAQISCDEVIRLHQSMIYSVYAIGFAPGFAYLGEVDSKIAMPRLATPRLKVPKGAVAIADRQTAIYPNVSPGGWNIIGCSPVNMFDQNATPTMPVNVGDKVKFNSISKEEFFALGGELPIFND
ncbi:5-oxoprolinase subunit PxpB [Litorilituus lipolyticus]|uniref:5-oxoprolinase subunit PxpB n=1 Tax=Litorilituus lipolyticus TaxID=2491017 RepID=A0A502KWA4_9GAMM|nr:5-oxoprolinase subunit PxpB [Litorilituus lipolyticus]TPH13953.1 5-oxoprolinase subunit PxpB [Litorilituus lipolyticus]